MDNKKTRINDFIDNIFKEKPIIKKIVKEIGNQQGKALLVGGAVRDLLLGITPKDIDIEVHGLTGDQLEEILKKFGEVSLVGKSFGVYRLHKLDIDWSLPRKDSSGRKPKVEINPFMGYEDAFRRRDLTINSMGINTITGELIDPFNGEKDLKNKILRATDPDLFLEDPLRFFRVMQFIGRFEMESDHELNEICKKMDISKISRERIEAEFEKLFLKSKRPSLGIRWLKDIGRLKEVLPEVYDLIDVQQNPEWHPEGDVFEHTMQAVDAAAKIECENENEKLILMWATLCHDLGKATTTKFEEGRFRSHGHENESERLSKKLLKRITNEKDLIDTVAKLSLYHLAPPQFIRNEASSAAYKRLARKLSPETNLEMLAKLSMADKLGRNIKGKYPLEKEDEEVLEFIKKAKKIGVYEKKEEPILQGKDLMGVVPPGPLMGEILKKAYEIQIEKGIKDKDELKHRALQGELDKD